jgi:hypothetical protein
MASVNEIARQYVNAARQEPRRASEILRHAAAHFASMASDPAHKFARDKLTTIGLDFAGAAMAQQAAQQAPEIQPPTTDDFSALLADTHQAMVELGPENAVSSNSAMDTLAERRMNDTEDARYMSVQPKSFLNRDTTLGRSTKIKFNPTQEEQLLGIHSSETVAFWQGAKQESQAMSVDFGLVLPAPIEIGPESTMKSPPVVDSRLYAKIQYGADGNTQNEATLDVRLGQRITVVGNYISVQVGMDPPRHYEPPGTDETIGITVPIIAMGASIGTFAAPSLAPVTRTIYIDQLSADFSSNGFPIPQRAVALLPPLAASPTDTLTIKFLTFNGILIGAWQCVYSPTTPFWSPYPIPADAYFFQVTSLQGVPFVVPTMGGRNGIRIPFELSL